METGESGGVIFLEKLGLYLIGGLFRGEKKERLPFRVFGKSLANMLEGPVGFAATGGTEDKLDLSTDHRRTVPTDAGHPLSIRIVGEP